MGKQCLSWSLREDVPMHRVKDAWHETKRLRTKQDLRDVRSEFSTFAAWSGHREKQRLKISRLKQSDVKTNNSNSYTDVDKVFNQWNLSGLVEGVPSVDFNISWTPRVYTWGSATSLENWGGGMKREYQSLLALSASVQQELAICHQKYRKIWIFSLRSPYFSYQSSKYSTVKALLNNRYFSVSLHWCASRYHRIAEKRERNARKKRRSLHKKADFA